MTEDDKQKIFDWLDQKWPSYNRCCEICGKGEWQIPRYLVNPPVLENGQMQLTNKGFPQVMVVCANCGHTRYFNALTIAGLLPSVQIQTESNG